MRETREQMKKTDRKIKELGKQIEGYLIKNYQKSNSSPSFLHHFMVHSGIISCHRKNHKVVCIVLS